MINRMGFSAVLSLTLLLGVVVNVNGNCGYSISGIRHDDICCAEECGSCGGDGCSERDGGDASCCLSAIEDAGVVCGPDSNFEGPCVIGSGDPHDGACVADERNDRIMEAVWTDEGMTRELCDAYCEENGYYYAGVQWGKECWCAGEDSDISKYGAGTCDYQCEGNRDEICGGFLAMSTFVTGSSGSGPSPIPSPNPSPNPSPTPIMTIPSTCELDPPSFRWAENSGINGRLYAEGEGCFTMTDLYNFRGKWDDGIAKGPVYILDEDDEADDEADEPTGKWLLTSELYVTGGGTFYCRGTDIGGDCDELRIQSTGPDDYHEIRGHGGNLYFENTLVTSWDTPNKEPQEDYEDGRSFLNCLSEVSGCVTEEDMGECRMDIINSEMGYMGYFNSESYGISWKVRGFCTDLSNPEVFDDVNVYGDIKDSDIHHMYYGMYSYGHQGGVWTNNKMHDNVQYGFDPHDDSDYLTISGNEVYNNGNHGIIASKRCNNVKIFNNEVRDGGENAVGIFLHRSSDNCEVYDNIVSNMQNAGLSVMESFDNDIHDNYVEKARYGIRFSVGAGRNIVRDNHFHDILRAAFYSYEGADDPWVGGSRPLDNEFYGNKVTDTDVGCTINPSDNISITDNEFVGINEVEFKGAHDTEFSGNSYPSDTCLKLREDPTFTDSSELPTELC